jgi:hypothetical protein
VSPAVASDRAAITEALRRTATGYDRLARAARAGDERGYSRARHAIRRSDAALGDGLGRLDPEDYTVG